ncbi:MAG: hypothetical protein ABJI96_02390 [Paracoccaceae bacterium]
MAEKTKPSPPATVEAKPVAEKPKRLNSPYPAIGEWLMFVDNPKHVDKIVYSLYVLCACLFAADFFYHKHVYLALEKVPGFYALYGFFMCAALVICAKAMRLFLKRDEDYYAPYDVEAEDYPEDGLDKDSHYG